MDIRDIAIVIAVLALMLPRLGLAHEVGLPAHEQPAVQEQPIERALHAGEDIEAPIEDVLEMKLAPIRAELAEIHAEVEKPRISDIVGGIGWIVGILGIAAYLKSRKG